MGDLIVLPRSKAPPQAVAAGGSAEILFFTGVRYYRMPEALVPAPARRRRRAKKPVDLLPLAEQA